MNPDHFDLWETYSQEHELPENLQLVEGGEERFFSVKNGLEMVPEHSDALVAIHDAVRPLIDPKRIERLIEEAAVHGSAIPSIPLRESVRKVEMDGSNQAVDRSSFKLVQTPQCFLAKKLKKAMKQDYSSKFTDEASVVEANGEPVHLAEGDPQNIKITTQMDLRIGEALMQEDRTKGIRYL